ncbi:cyclin-H isoform X2 [Octopus sinensis]|uniref:Cyclin-H n=1 Tax=Octopus sinensis TaxID=2607531 RepID=A0A6P7T4X1_9MOLL|nr:cyclin-H isoform X1 [Octopus sinensis]XP_029645894.1 cyclin-H isoform X2 [Octopus sinensis]
MFAISTQKSHWTFDSDSALTRLRRKAHDDYVESHRGSISDEDLEAVLFTYEEEYILARHYEFIMKEFCNRFQPPMPKYVLGTAMTYFKRFYLYNSVMDFHPRDITLTSVYLASKVEEFNVSINQFVGNLKGDRDKFANVILGFELLLMEKLSYHLTVHNPFRPLEGFLIDMKTNCQTCSDPEILRQQAEEFLEKSMLTDICLLVSPAQISLAAILDSCSLKNIDIMSYVTSILMKGAESDQKKRAMQQIKLIQITVNNQNSLKREHIRQLEKKLEKCRNQENNPDSEVYKKKMQEMFEDEKL